MSNNSTNISTFKTLGFIEIRDDEFKKLRDLIYRNIGITLSEDKRTLVTGRLQKTLRQMQFKSFSEYIDYIKNDKSGKTLSDLANTISTNHTFFGREKDHFDYFEKITLPELIYNKSRDKDLRIWSAGCSSGEEPYTLVMIMMEVLGSEYSKWTAGCLATDISERVLDIAQTAEYTADRVDGLSKVFRSKYFDKTAQNDILKVSQKVRNEVIFRRFNLMNEVFPFKKKFDVIFCRNVMIYFDEVTRIKLAQRFYDSLNPGGYLFIGHSETLNRQYTDFNYIQPAVYKK